QHRRAGSLTSDALAANLMAKFKGEIKDATASIFHAPPVDGLGTAGGFKIIIEDRGSLGLDAMQEVADKVVESGGEQPELGHPYTSFRANTPWLFLDLDREQAKTMGLQIDQIGATMQGFLASYYINDFNRFGRTWQVNIQARPQFRSSIEKLKQLQVPNGHGSMSPLASVVRVKETTGPVMVVRYNMYPAAAVTATASPSASSGQAIDALQDVTDKELRQISSM